MHRLLVGLLALSLAALVFAQILLKPSGGSFQPLTTKSIEAVTKIDRGLATTTLTLVFSNQASNRIEADFVYTVRPGTLVTGFAYWYRDEKVVARVVERERAREIYDTITRPGKDPALVELIGKRTFRARIFPIEPMADLRVELKMVQPLEQGKGFVLPLEMPQGEKLDNLDVRIEVVPDPTILNVKASVPMKVTDRVYRLQAKSYRPQKDLRVTLGRAPRALRAALYAARSGSNDGYFTLSLTPSRTWRVERLDIRGVSTTGVRFPNRLTANETALVTGRYSGSGPATLVFKPRGAPAIEVPLVFTTSVEANHPGMKLWAAEEIERLGESEGVRRQVVALSTRHTIPSKFTSWLAIPVEERRNFEEQIKRSRATQLARLLGREIAAGRQKSARGRQLDAQLTGLVKELKLDKKDLLRDVLAEHTYKLAESVSREIEQKRENGAKAKAQLAELARLTKLTGIESKTLVADSLYPMSWQQVERLVDEIGANRGEERVANAIRKELQRLARWTGRREGVPGDLLEQSLVNAIWLWHGKLEERKDGTIRDYAAIAEAERTISRLVEAAGPAGRDALAKARARQEDPATLVRRRLLELLRTTPRDRPAIQKAERALAEAVSWRGKQWNEARMERLDVEVTLERVQGQPRTREVERLVAELKQRQQELRARMGDPLISSNAPETARLVVARMPNGEVKRLEWNPLSRRWEARFDIPATAADGEYEIEVIAVLAGGERRITTVKYHVDNTAPMGAVALLLRDGKLRIDVACSTDTARVEAVLPWGDLVSLERSAEGRFFCFVDLPKSVERPIRIRVILTDKAHNRGAAEAVIER